MLTIHKLHRSISFLLLAALLISQKSVRAEGDNHQYLSASKLSLIGAASISVFVIGHLVRHVDTTSHAIIRGPLPGEAGFQRAFGGKWHPGKTNFLDGNIGSAITPTAFGSIMLIADATWPRHRPTGDAGEDLMLYLSGLTATKGTTSLFKGLFARPRPMLTLEPELARQREKSDVGDDRRSFFSGHSSSAFFAATFVNHRLRDILRQRLNPGEYRDWRWLPPTVLFGWSSFVGWSRIHAYKHYLSDVLVGSLAGYLIGELFHSFLDDVSPPSTTKAKASHLISFRISF